MKFLEHELEHACPSGHQFTKDKLEKFFAQTLKDMKLAELLDGTSYILPMYVCTVVAN